MSRRRTTSLGQGDRGAVAIIVAVFVVVGMILLAFVVDRGRVYLAQSQLQNAVDAGALAGGWEMCDGDESPEQVAVDYAAANGVSPVLTDYRAAGGNEFLNVRANQTLDLLFGPFVSTDSVAVAAQATIERNCYTDFRLVAKETTKFTGTSNDADNIYAGNCFLDGGNGSTFGLVAVATKRDGTIADNVCGSSYDYPIHAESSVSDPRYEVPLDFDALVAASGITAKIAAVKAAIPSPVQCKDVAKSETDAPWSTQADIYCVGKDTLVIPGKSDDSYVYTGNIVAECDPVAPTDCPAIDMTESTILAKKAGQAMQLIYSQAQGDAITYQGDIGSDTTFYAPNGTAKESGSGAVMDGRIFSKDIVFAGGGQDAGTGFQVRLAEDPRLTQ